MRDIDNAKLSRQFRDELVGNILPFWMTVPVDKENGGLHGAVGNDLRVHDDVPRSAVLCARVLWTFSAAYRRLGDPRHLAMAQRTCDDLVRTFWDRECAGLYWEVDRGGRPVADRKHHYAQAFGIYGLSEFHRATGDARSLDLARTLFERLEQHAFDPRCGGYSEGSTRDWRPSPDARLSDKDLAASKSMNTMLHLLEAYTNLLRVWDDERLRRQVAGIVRAFAERIVDPATGHLQLFFDERWRPLTDAVSFGHDIETSWLLCEAADLADGAELQSRAKHLALRLAETTLRDGVDADGSLASDGPPGTAHRAGKEWWPQAEAIVGFYNAYQLTGDQRFSEAAIRCWEVVQERFVDRVHGDWFKHLFPDGRPDPAGYKAGPWDCPYHHGRACLEMLERLDERP